MRQSFHLTLGFFIYLAATITAAAQPLPVVTPEQAGMNSDVLKKADRLIESAIEEGETPGAVLLVLRDGNIVWNRSFGRLERGGESVTSRTVYDLASLTKPVVTATVIMQLIERGLLRLEDPVSRYLPDFRSPGDDDQTIRIVHLLTHTSGLPAYPPVEELLAGGSDDNKHNRDRVYTWLDRVERDFPAGSSFQYSCPNFVTLQRIAETVTGSNLSDYALEHIFTPLAMELTGYLPPESWSRITAPTGITTTGAARSCIVHDPFARDLMGGISGNAGLFSTAEDLALFAAMMLNGGSLNGKRVLSPASVNLMIRAPDGLERHGRALGWDLDSAFASNQGDLFGPQTYGHTGFTGTSLIIDPDTRIAVILLSNRVHPTGGGGSVVRLRSLIANIVAASIQE